MRYKGTHHGDNVLYIDYIVNPSFGINSRNEYAFANNQHLDFLVRISYLFEIDKCFSVSYGKKEIVSATIYLQRIIINLT